MIAPPRLAAPAKFGDFEGRMLHGADVPALISLRHQVLASLSDPDLYVNEDDEEGFLRTLCGERGETYGVFEDGRLVAYGAVDFPAADDADNLGLVLGLHPQRLGQVAHIASCMVLPSHRGHGLQQALLRARFALALACGRSLAVAMVSLRNHESRHNMLRQGMCINWVGVLDHGLQRQLLVRDLATPAQEGAPAVALRRIPAGDFEAQCAAAREGFRGIGEIRDGRDIWIEFARY